MSSWRGWQRPPARVVYRCCQRDMLPYAPDISLALDQDFTEVGIGVVYSGDFPVLGRRTSQNRKFFVVLLRTVHISCLAQSVATPFGTVLSCSRSILPLDVVYKGPLAVLHSSLLSRTHTLSLSLSLSRSPRLSGLLQPSCSSPTASHSPIRHLELVQMVPQPGWYSFLLTSEVYFANES